MTKQQAAEAMALLQKSQAIFCDTCDALGSLCQLCKERQALLREWEGA